MEGTCVVPYPFPFKTKNRRWNDEIRSVDNSCYQFSYRFRTSDNTGGVFRFYGMQTRSKGSLCCYLLCLVLFSIERYRSVQMNNL